MESNHRSQDSETRAASVRGGVATRSARRRVQSPPRDSNPPLSRTGGACRSHDHQMGVAVTAAGDAGRNREDRTLHVRRVRTTPPPGGLVPVAEEAGALARTCTGMVTGCSRVPDCSTTSARVDWTGFEPALLRCERRLLPLDDAAQARAPADPDRRSDREVGRSARVAALTRIELA